MSNNILKHKHLIIRAEINKPPVSTDIDKMHVWFKETIEHINMKILMGPYLVYHDMIGNRGFTGMAIIETSHIAMHVWDECEPALMQLDVYSCSQFWPDQIIERMKIFDPKKIEYLYLDREFAINSVITQKWHPVGNVAMAAIESAIARGLIDNPPLSGRDKSILGSGNTPAENKLQAAMIFGKLGEES